MKYPNGLRNDYDINWATHALLKHIPSTKSYIILEKLRWSCSAANISLIVDKIELMSILNGLEKGYAIDRPTDIKSMQKIPNKILKSLL